MRVGRIRLYEVLRWIFPKSCYKLQLEIVRMYENLGVDLKYEKCLDDENIEDGAYVYKPKVILRESNSKIVNRVQDVSSQYTSRQMRKKF